MSENDQRGTLAQWLEYFTCRLLADRLRLNKMLLCILRRQSLLGWPQANRVMRPGRLNYGDPQHQRIIND